MSALTKSPPRSEPSLWRNQDFLTFWFGETVSLLGSQVTVIALPLTAVLTLNAGSQQLGALRFVYMLPYLAFGLLVGIWVDRVRRRQIMLGANLARLVLIGCVPVLFLTGHLRVAVLFVVAFGVGFASLLFDVSWMSYLPTLVRDRGRLVEANAKLGATSSAAETVGQGMAGVLVNALTAPVAMALDAASYLVSLVSLLFIRQVEPAPVRPPGPRRQLGREFVEGLSIVARNQYLRAVALVGALCNFFMSANQTLFIVYAVRDWSLRPYLLAVIFSIGSTGGIVGGLAARWLTRRLTVGRAYGWALGLAFLSPVLLPAACGPWPLVTGAFAIAFFLGYLGVSVTNVIILSIRQTVTPGPLLGRMNGATRTLMFGLGAVGALLGGSLGQAVGPQRALWVSVAGSTLALIPVLLSPVRRLREMPAPIA